MASKQKRYKYPIVYLYIYSKLLDNKLNLEIGIKQLKVTVKKCIISNDSIENGGIGGNRKGLPRAYLYDVINDLVSMALIRRINNKRYRITEPSSINELHRLHKLPF